MEAHGTQCLLERGAYGRLKLGERELEDGEEFEVLWQGRWMRGRLEYVWWRSTPRMWCGGCSIDLKVGMQARRVLEE